MRRIIVVLIVLVLSAIVFIPPATAAEALTLSTKDQTALKALGIKIAVPTYVPTGYAVKKVEVEPCSAGSPRSSKGTCRFGPRYSISYRNAVAKDSCFFAIEAVGGGLGGPAFEFRKPFSTSLFGEVAVEFGKPDGSAKVPSAAQLNSPQPGLRSDWGSEDRLKSGPFYHVIGHPLKPAPECGNTITPNEVIKIVQSLTWLK
ncbi:MAG: hypothetical protein KME18_26800 [Phormidium tanganyikae FI6-MK23]|jgi:hypothetical protein|nr:hypothetical protein [Phormidium tanganyikae FI6-MK23]